jgi:methanethiol S-methyltransferase
MDATRERGWARALGIFFGLGTQAAFAITVCYLFWFLRDSGTAGEGRWLGVDLLLSLQFAVAHSALLLPRVRDWIGRRMAKPLFGTLFCFSTCVSLWLVFANWRGSEMVVWDAAGTATLGVRGAFYLSWGALFYSLSLSGFGYQTGWTQWWYWFRRERAPARELVDRGALRWMRHPVYLSFLGLIWFTPCMTADRLLLAGVWSVYITVGSMLKDWRSTHYIGDGYREYASRVAGYPGVFFGPLGKWPLR